jgi:hypothetical protein
MLEPKHRITPCLCVPCTTPILPYSTRTHHHQQSLWRTAHAPWANFLRGNIGWLLSPSHGHRDGNLLSPLFDVREAGMRLGIYPQVPYPVTGAQPQADFAVLSFLAVT